MTYCDYITKTTGEQLSLYKEYRDYHYGFPIENDDELFERLMSVLINETKQMRKSDREVSDFEAIEEIIKKADVCRIALATDNIPYMVTMNFGYTNDPDQLLFFHCANEGRKLEIIRRNKYVCFEMDIEHQIFIRPGNDDRKGCNWGMKYRSVVGYGNISIITEKEAKKTGLDCIMKHYGDENEYIYDEKVLEKTTILRLQILEMTGKKS